MSTIQYPKHDAPEIIRLERLARFYGCYWRNERQKTGFTKADKNSNYNN